MSKFSSQWDAPPKKLGNVRFNSTALKEILTEAQNKLKIQINRLDMIMADVVSRDHKLFSELIKHLEQNNKDKANVIAVELSQLRKVQNMLLKSKMALEQIILRIGTVTDLGDVTYTLAPAVRALKNVRKDMAIVSPEADSTFGEITTNLSNILTAATQSETFNMDLSTNSDEAAKIVEEAASIAELKLRTRIPEPSSSNLVKEAEAT
ncbi:MAG: hypothetical protein QXX95_01180 [Nitrososphaerales archaeon]